MRLLRQGQVQVDAFPGIEFHSQDGIEGGLVLAVLLVQVVEAGPGHELDFFAEAEMVFQAQRKGLVLVIFPGLVQIGLGADVVVAIGDAGLQLVLFAQGHHAQDESAQGVVVVGRFPLQRR